MAVGKLNYTFGYEGFSYMADIIHYEYLTKEEIERYKVMENTFLVHLFSPVGVTSFELFMNENFDWQTKPEIDQAITNIIVNEIELRSL